MTRAIVIGSSIAGLTAAHVLSQHFDEVTIIDRDQISDKAEVRKGVPQGYHAHLILRRGLNILEEHFPGLTAELRAGSARDVNFGAARFYIFGGWRKAYKSKLGTVACSRPMLEATIYRRILKNPRINIIAETEVVGLCLDDTGTRATGVQLRARKNHNEAERYSSVEGDLIVDTSGRDSHAPEWLTDAGYVAPEEVVVNGLAGYASRIYQPPASFNWEWDILMMQPSAPAGKRGAVVVPMENGLWQVLLLGAGGEYPPTDEEGFMEYIRSLPTSALYDALQGATPMSPIYGYRRTENQMRYYEKLPRYLEHFLVMGDSVCSFNPMYGQGMSVASMESLVLAECMEEYQAALPNADFKGLAATFQKRVAEVIAMPWQLASGEDRRWIAGEKPDAPTRFMQWYIEQVLRASLTNTTIAEVFYGVQNLLDAPTVLFRPDVMVRVFATRLMNR
jgi:2-polyprenyl-6-methoxyphenol hydroxylase-like FAD-dependent oxidoreductase